MMKHSKGSELEDSIESTAEAFGWRVEKRRKKSGRIPDLILIKGGIVFVVQAKNTDMATARDVSQARKDYQAYIEWLLSTKLGLMVRPILVSRGFSSRAKARARSYGVLLYTPEELSRLLS